MGQVEAQRTPPKQPKAVEIADDLRIQIETGKLRPGAPLPTVQEIMRGYATSSTTARDATDLLSQQGLVVRQRGKRATVRPAPRRVERSSTRHQTEKDLVRQPEKVRQSHGLAENDMGGLLDDYELDAKYSIVPADAGLADAFRVPEGTSLLRREFSHRAKKSGALEAWSISWIPRDLIANNPEISDPAKAAWPGGTMHQLYTVGVEVDKIADYVTAAMPTTVEAQAWELHPGTPLLWVRRVSIDTNDRVVEVSDAQYPADRTMLSFHTHLTRWSSAE